MIEKILSNTSEIKNIGETKIENGYLDEINLKKLIKCWKDNIIYEIYFEELLDYIDIESFSNSIIDVMIKENVGIEKISHMPLKDEILLNCIKENEYIYDLEIAQNIFASEQILRELMKLKGLKYCKEIKRRAEETLQKKMMICVID